MLWIKSLHIITMVCWFAGLFYLPRLFVYHTMAAANNETDSIKNLKIMERKLYYGITIPSMLLTWILGLILLFSYAWNSYSGSGWLHAKIMLVILLTIYSFSMGYYLKKLKSDTNTKSHRFFRFYNEIPVIFLVAIVILVIVKPF